MFKLSETEIHRLTTRRVTDLLFRHRITGWGVDASSGVTLSDGEPKPDAMIVRGAADDYDAEYPTPKDVGLLVEVADQTLSRDRGIKLRSYARAGIICYWIINLIDRQIEVHTHPDTTGPDAKAEVPGYRDRQVFKAGDSVPLVIEGQTVAQISVGDLLPNQAVETL